MNTPQRLAQYIQPNLPEARIAHQWSRLANAELNVPWWRIRLVKGLAYSLAFSCVLVATVHWFGPTLTMPVKGVALENGQAGQQTVMLPDGSRVQLAARSRMTIDEFSDAKVQLSLGQGHAQLEVTHQQKRPFLIEAADYEIRVVGTRFSVDIAAAADQPVVTVEVQQGKVAVRNRRSPQEVSTLAAGQSWTSGRVAAGVTATSNDEPAAELHEVPTEGSPSSSARSDAPPGVEPPSVSEAAAKIGPRELLERAEQLRIGGKLRESAEILNKLRLNYRSDPRASLAAFELGRMRMDTFGDLNGSVEALRDAIAINPSATFREDAESRLVQIYYRQGNLEKCRAAKNAYLKRFPGGAANKVVSRLCEP
jgi:hypothetical protein